MNTSIYVLMHPLTNEVRYVGKTKYHPNDRLLSHIREINKPDKKNFHSKNWIRSMMKEGLIPKLEVVETCDESNWVEREMFWIEYYKGIDSDLTNMTLGGDGNAGKMPDTWKNPRNIPVDVYDIKGNLLKSLTSLQKAEEYTGCHTGKISAICKGKASRNSCNSYVFRYKDDSFEREKKDKVGTRVFALLEESLVLYKIYESSKIASEDTKVDDSYIRLCCGKPFHKSGKRRSRNGFVFLHENDYLILTDFCEECRQK